MTLCIEIQCSVPVTGTVPLASANIFCSVESNQASKMQTSSVIYKYNVRQCCPMQCIASNVFCPEESSQASQMHLVRSHDNSPDLFADNDGSALMKMVMMRFEIIMTMVIIMVMVVVRLDQCK